jgi:hypothetical protein
LKLRGRSDRVLYTRFNLGANRRLDFFLRSRDWCLLPRDDGFLFVAQFLDLDGLNFSPACLFDDGGVRTTVDDGFIDDPGIRDEGGLVDDSRIIGDYRGGTDRIQKTALFDKDISSLRDA